MAIPTGMLTQIAANTMATTVMPRVTVAWQRNKGLAEPGKRELPDARQGVRSEIEEKTSVEEVVVVPQEAGAS